MPADLTLLVNESPDVSELNVNFITKHTFSRNTAGTSSGPEKFNPYKRIDGPAIIKVQADASANNLDVDAGFNGYVIKKSEWAIE